MNIVEELQKVGAVYTEKHFVYASGKHGSGYINLDPIFPHTVLMGEICKLLTNPFLGSFDTTAAPATGGIVSAVLSAFVSSTPEHPVCGVWADKAGDGRFEFEREGFSEHLKGKKVLVVEDLVTTGGSVEKVCREVEKCGGEVVGVSVIYNRGGVKAGDIGVPRLEALVNISFSTFESENCELCQNRVPIVEDIGHGDDYKESHSNYEGGYVKLLN